MQEKAPCSKNFKLNLDMIVVKQVTEKDELKGISKLQKANLRKNISTEEAAEQGFVTAQYTLAFLAKMHKASPAIVAKVDREIVAYALVALRKEALGHPLLLDLVQQIDKCVYREQKLENVDYVIVGQLCVAKNYRGKGLSQQLYLKFKACYAHNFTYCITDVASNNKPSLAAHQKIGFETIASLNYGGIAWDIVLWNWRAPHQKS